MRCSRILPTATHSFFLADTKGQDMARGISSPGFWTTRLLRTGRDECSDITNDQLGISGETGHGGANLRVY